VWELVGQVPVWLSKEVLVELLDGRVLVLPAELALLVRSTLEHAVRKFSLLFFYFFAAVT